jgi:plasmid maintenance system antidote protein VapI
MQEFLVKEVPFLNLLAQLLINMITEELNVKVVMVYKIVQGQQQPTVELAIVMSPLYGVQLKEHAIAHLILF